LQKQRRRQQARRDARTPVVHAVEVGEVLVAEQLFAMHSEEAVEGVPPHVIEVGMLAAIRIRLPPEHRKLLLVDLKTGVYSNGRLGAFRPRF
jgi:hypothetical protein